MRPVGQRVRKFLAAHHVMSLSTWADGDLWAASVFYASDGLELLFVSSPDSRHGRNLTRDPRVAATIHGEPADWRDITGIQLEGRTSWVQPEGVAAALEVYVARFPWAGELRGPSLASPSGGPGLVRIAIGGKETSVAFCWLRPERVVLVDNRRGFGHREELEVGPT